MGYDISKAPVTGDFPAMFWCPQNHLRGISVPVSSATATPPVAPRLASVAPGAPVVPVALRPALATDTGDAKADAMAAMSRWFSRCLLLT